MKHFTIFLLVIKLQYLTGKLITQSACEGETVTLSCDAKNPIKLARLLFGRPTDGSVHCEYKTGDCLLVLTATSGKPDINLFESVSTSCANQTFCSVRAVSTLISDCQLTVGLPPGATSTYMTLEYECSAKPIIVTKPPEDKTTTITTTSTTKGIESTTENVPTTTAPETESTTPETVITTPVLTTEPSTTQKTTTTSAEQPTSTERTTDPGVPTMTTQETTTANNTAPTPAPSTTKGNDWILPTTIGSIVSGSAVLIMLKSFIMKLLNRKKETANQDKGDGNGGVTNPAYIDAYNGAPMTSLQSSLPGAPMTKLPVTDRMVNKMTSYHKTMEIDVDALYKQFNPRNGSATTNGAPVGTPTSEQFQRESGIVKPLPPNSTVPNGVQQSNQQPAPTLAVVDISQLPRLRTDPNNRVVVTNHGRPVQPRPESGRFSRIQDNNDSPALTPADGDLYYAYQQMPEQDYCFYGELYPPTKGGYNV